MAVWLVRLILISFMHDIVAARSLTRSLGNCFVSRVTDKVESDSHSEGHQRSSVSSTESAQPLPPPLALSNPPPGRCPNNNSSSGSTCGQYPVLVGRAQDVVRPHVYTELKTFSPGIHVRQPCLPPPRGGAGGGGHGDPGSTGHQGSTMAVSCTASLPRYRIPNSSGTRTTTTFGREPTNGAQTVTTFGTPLPLGGDVIGDDNGNTSPESGPYNNQTVLPTESRPHSNQRSQTVRISEPPKAPSIPETNSEDNSPQHQQQQQHLTEQQQRQQNIQSQGQRTPPSEAGNCNDVTSSEIKRDVTDGDTSQDSGVVDPQELCQSIDDAFFKGMVIKHKTLV